MLFKSKADNLEQLEKLDIKGIIIPKFYSLKVIRFLKDKDNYLKKISNIFEKKVAVRSSSFGEDSYISSQAGAFKSFLNINPKNKIEMKNSIMRVYESYKVKNNNQKVLIQDMVENVKISGVAISCDLSNNCSSYIVCNYSIGDDTTLVTSGEGNLKNFHFFKGSSLKNVPKIPKIIIKNIFNLISETSEKLIDIEFAIDSNNNFFLLQLRPIILKKQKHMREINPLYLNKLEKKIIKLKKSHPNLHGNTTFFGVMPDWNPAEMIGIKPKNMSVSLYKELITDKVWSTQRSDYGFKDVKNNQLMSVFLGTPFIDIRTDFNSWLPKSLSKGTAIKLMKYYLKKIRDKKELHDNVEFEILFTCFNFNSSKVIEILKKNKFTVKEINEVVKSLKKITIDSIKKFENEFSKIKILQKKQGVIEKSKMYEFDKIYWHIVYCKEFGTLPFAGLARIAFIAYDILNSLYNRNFINEKQKNLFLGSLKTISLQIDDDFNNLSKKKFIEKHGHLRPNTYEISSLNYSEGYDNYYGSKKKKNKAKNKKNKFKLSNNQSINISNYLRKHNIDLSTKDLFKFIRKAIETREYSKYIFTKSIDLVFKNMIKIGKRLDIKRDDISFLEINDFLKLYYSLSSADISKEFKRIIKRNKKEYILNGFVKLPNIIINPSDIYYNSENVEKGSFFGNIDITGEVFFLNESELKTKDLKQLDNKIICIYNADPGFDFIFSKKILGLITCYGGSNSHMAIRCSEKNITSIIGIGNHNFKKIINSKRISIEAMSKKYSLL